MDPSRTLRTEADRTGRLSVVVIEPESVRTVMLPSEGTLTIGRGESCEVRLDDPGVSRTHARIHVEEGRVQVEDLGSANGTRARGRRLADGAREEIFPSEVIDVGATMLVLQRAESLRHRWRFYSHADLESRLEEECARNAGGRRSPFALLRIRINGSMDREQLTLGLREILGRSDLMAPYAPGEYHLLLLDAAPPKADWAVERIVEAITAAGCRVDIGLACHPEDGLTANALVGAANAAISGPSLGPEQVGVVLEDPSMRELHRVIDRVAQGRISVLLLGETGVGKEVIAEALHTLSPRREQPFVRLNCAALSEAIVEAELFGYVKGAFTGADEDRLGLLPAADGGTIFLDELGELPLATQAKLLRVMELKEVRPVGGIRSVPVDVRFVSATNRDLEAEVARGAFREDLLYRLNGVSLVIPPLRERAVEIAPLAHYFATRVAADLGVPTPPITPDALELLEAYQWPGNIRELKNIVERAILLSGGEKIEPIHLPIDKLTSGWTAKAIKPLKRLTQAEAEKRRRIVEALDRHAGNQTRAAQALGISRQTLSKWLSRYDIPRPRA